MGMFANVYMYLQISSNCMLDQIKKKNGTYMSVTVTVLNFISNYVYICVFVYVYAYICMYVRMYIYIYHIFMVPYAEFPNGIKLILRKVRDTFY